MTDRSAGEDPGSDGESDGESDGDAGFRRRSRAWRHALVVVYLTCAGLLIPWIFHLLRRQPPVAISYHSSLLWALIAVLMLSGLVATGVLYWRRSLYAVLTATFTSTFLFIGAWFDVLTSTGLLHKVLVVFAVAVQLPISVLSFVVAYRLCRDRATPAGGTRLVSAAFVVGAVLLVPTSVRRVVKVAPVVIALHQRVTWSGLDIFEFAGLLATGWCLRERSPWLAMVGTATATLLLSDALFNIVTSSDGSLLGGILMAVVAELPLAALSLVLAAREVHSWHAGAGGPDPRDRADRPDRTTVPSGPVAEA